MQTTKVFSVTFLPPLEHGANSTTSANILADTAQESIDKATAWAKEIKPDAPFELISVEPILANDSGTMGDYINFKPSEPLVVYVDESASAPKFQAAPIGWSKRTQGIGVDATIGNGKSMFDDLPPKNDPPAPIETVIDPNDEGNS